jgi:hypothetical protein
VLLQDSGLPGDLTVRETVQTWARTLTDPRPVGAALAQVDLAGRADVRVGSLSGGERRRLDVALALLGRPGIAVLDEPTTGPDPESRRVLLGTAVPTLLITVAQVSLVAAGVAVLGEWRTPADVVLPLIALLGGSAPMVLLAVVSTSFTRTVEAAQITTFPMIIGAMLFSGLLHPLTGYPAARAQGARFLPLTPVIELARLGLAGQTWDGRAVGAAGAWAAAPLPLAVLAGWLIGGAVLARLVSRWAPRR